MGSTCDDAFSGVSLYITIEFMKTIYAHDKRTSKLTKVTQETNNLTAQIENCKAIFAVNIYVGIWRTRIETTSANTL